MASHFVPTKTAVPKYTSVATNVSPARFTHFGFLTAELGVVGGSTFHFKSIAQLRAPSMVRQAKLALSLCAPVKTSLREQLKRGLRGCTESMQNEYGVDAFGFNLDYAFSAVGPFVWLCKNYFRCETHGIEKVPAGRVRLVSNHGGQLPIDGSMICIAMLTEARLVTQQHVVRTPSGGVAKFETGSRQLPFVSGPNVTMDQHTTEMRFTDSKRRFPLAFVDTAISSEQRAFPQLARADSFPHCLAGIRSVAGGRAPGRRPKVVACGRLGDRGGEPERRRHFNGRCRRGLRAGAGR